MTKKQAVPRAPSAFAEIRHPKKRAFLLSFAATGSAVRAAESSGISRTLPYTKAWREDREFQEALARAKVMASELLEEEAYRRAMEGVRRYKFHRGKPVLHPDLCECHHSRMEHQRLSEQVDQPVAGPCTVDGCSCPGFVGTPYYEHRYSDVLLMFMLKAINPEYRDDFVAREAPLPRISDWAALPRPLLARIAAGEDPRSVLESVIPQLVDAGIIRIRRRQLGAGGT